MTNHLFTLIVSFITIFSVIGLVLTLVPSETPPLFYVDYPETVEGCAGGRIYSEAQVKGMSKYVNYQENTKTLHCYDYYTTIKPVGTPAGERPTVGRCYKQKCCWFEPPLERVKHPPTQKRMFDSMRSWFRYSPAAEAARGKAPTQVPWICTQ